VSYPRPYHTSKSDQQQDALGLPPFRAATALFIYFAAAIAGVIYFYALESLQFYVRGLRRPQLTSLFQRSLLVCSFALPTVLPIGCIIAYVRSAILESFDYNRLYFVTLFMAGVGSVCLARQIWCFAYIMVEGGIPGRAAIAEIISKNIPCLLNNCSRYILKPYSQRRL
jgi:ABC-type sulfate transport system permease component